MLNYIEYLNMPTKVTMGLVGILLTLQVIGEFLEFKGKIVPEFMKVRKYFARKKKERETIAQLPALIEQFNQIPSTLERVEMLLSDVEQHYSTDNIAKRDSWMNWVNSKAIEYDNYGTGLAELEKKMDKNNAITLSLLIDSKRNSIINFASNVIDENSSVTREQFKRIFKIYEEYEEIIEENELTNGEVDIAIRIIRESYERHMRNHTFVEDVRGYNV